MLGIDFDCFYIAIGSYQCACTNPTVCFVANIPAWRTERMSYVDIDGS